MTTLWPSMTDYSGAIQNAEHSFRLPALAGAEFATLPMMGLPAFASGQNAVVFSAKIGSTSTAVRCFTSPSHEGRRRYIALEEHLRTHPVSAMASASWIDDAIELNGRLWPVVTMDWIDGEQLHDWVGDHLYDQAALLTLALAWTSTCGSLRQSAVTHGDLQHGNVLVDTQGSLRLIDFDGVWLPEIDDAPPSEVGHPNYQHPERSETGSWGWSIDWFSALGVLVSLRALAADPSLWALHNGENLIFKQSDYWGDAEVWRLLERSPDNGVVELADLLAQGCGHRCDAPYDLATILTQGLVETTPPEGLGSPPTSPSASPKGRPPSDQAASTPQSQNAWWTHHAQANDPETRSTPPQAEPVRPRAHTESSAHETSASDVNFVWVTGGTQANTSGPTSGSNDRANQRARPPERERPEEQEVQAGWTNDGPPPPPSNAQPKAPQSPRPASASHLGSAPTPPSMATQPSRTPVLGYLLVIAIFILVGIVIGALAGGA